MIKEICFAEKANKIILLGDYAHYYGIDDECRQELSKLPCRPITIEGNCDNGCGDVPEADYQGEIYTETAFSRVLCFTHGDRYNISNIPPFLQKGDILFYGHTHTGGLAQRGGIYIANCGSLSRPRYGYQPSYITVDNDEILLKSSENGEILEKITIF